MAIAVEELPAPARRRELSKLSSEGLAVRAREGCSDSFEVLAGRHRNAVQAFLVRKTGNQHDAEDLTQETFSRVYRNLSKFDAERNFRSWLFTIAARLAISHYRKKGSVVTVSIDSLVIQEDGAEPGEQERADGLWGRARELLGDDLYRMLWHRYGQGFSIDEVARETGSSKTRIAVALYRARVKLRKDKTFRTMGDL